eukprot:TRINITY_DN7085_c0_g1_i1.p1 TRINITY_DN7085_c0_g1~~TRINITY_DN7085_c0_g1_i1.p1  ORF type:complete len:881 (-),score=159.67 TRINITY_DN7085_c0_g1_i1:50-2404(-)
MGSFGSGITTELFLVQYVTVTSADDDLGFTGSWPDPINPIEPGNVQLTGGKNNAIWVLVHVYPNATTGDHSADLNIGSVAVPVTLHVFNFELPSMPSVAGQMYINFENILNRYGVAGTSTDYWNYVDSSKAWFLQHRLSPAGPLWPGGLTGGGSGGAPFISYDCDKHTFSDTYGVWGFEQPATKYILGNGWNTGLDGTVGFPYFIAIGTSNNDASADQRPATFCGTQRSSSDYPITSSNRNSAYNSKWFTYITAMQSYLEGLHLLDRTYAYLWNEPQNKEDYDAVASYSAAMKSAAPKLRLMVSEEAKPEIYDNPTYPNVKIDFWWPVLRNFNPTTAWQRLANNDEESWVYFLTHNDRPPYFDPITLDHPGVEYMLTGFFLWKNRITGIGYYSFNDWSSNPWTTPKANGEGNGDASVFYPPGKDNKPITFGSSKGRFVPSHRMEIMRDSLDVYEYLKLLNSGSYPEPYVSTASDAQASKVIYGLRSYMRDDEFIYNLRLAIGRKVAGEVATLEDVQPIPRTSRAKLQPQSFFINFQDPSGSPTGNVVVNNNTYMKVGWTQYNEGLGYGWYGLTDQRKYQTFSTGNSLHDSVIYDDYGRYQSFQFDLPSALYSVTVGIGWNGKSYEHNTVNVNGISFFDEVNNNGGYLNVTKQILVKGSQVMLEMGCPDGEYTMLAWMTIVLVGTTNVPDCSAKPCGQHATCYYPSECLCDGGYAGSGYNCQPDCSENPCDVHATCSSSGTCKCNSGYSGDGHTCTINDDDNGNGTGAVSWSILLPLVLALLALW